MTATMIEAAVRGMVFAALVGAGLGVLRVTNVPVRKAAWTLVLVASMGMPFLMQWPALAGVGQRFAWVVPMRRAVLAAPVAKPDPVPVVAIPNEPMPVAGPVDEGNKTVTAIPIIDASPVVPVATAAPEAGPTAMGQVGPAIAPRRVWQWPPLGRMVVLVYLAVGGALVLRLLWGLGAALWIWARAEEVSPLVAPEPNVRVSEKIASPVTIGSGILLPAQYTEWDRAKLRVVLAHERSHVRQGDFYLQMLAGLYTAAFWFSPLGWWLKRKLAGLGEAISDRAGIAAAPSRTEYAGVLLEFAAGTRRPLPGVAMARPGNLSRRVEQMLNENLFRRAFAEGRRRAVASLLLVPAALFAVTALVRMPSAAAQDTAAPPPAASATAGQSNPPENQVTTTVAPPAKEDQQVPSPAPVNPGAPPPAPQAAPNPDQAPAPAPTATPAVAPAPPDPWDAPMVLQDVGPMPEVWAKVPKMPDMKIVMPKLPDVQAMALDSINQAMSLMGPGGVYLMQNGGMNGYAYHFSSNGDSWAIVDGPMKNFSFSGNGATKEQLDLAQRMAKGPFLWFSHEGKSYIVDDPAIVAQIKGLYDPMKHLGQQQRELGVQEGVLGRMEGELARQERTDANVRVPDLSKEMAEADAALQNLKSAQGQMMSEEKLATMERQLAEVERRLAQAQMKAAMQNNFGQKMQALGEQQRQLGEEQRQLGEQQKKQAEEAEQQVESILQQCLQNGKATLVSPGK